MRLRARMPISNCASMRSVDWASAKRILWLMDFSVFSRRTAARRFEKRWSSLHCTERSRRATWHEPRCWLGTYPRDAVFAAKPNLRLLLLEDLPDARRARLLVKPIAGALLAQTRDNGAVAAADLRVVTQRAPTERLSAETAHTHHQVENRAPAGMG